MNIKNITIRSVSIILIGVLNLGITGCARFSAPAGKLPYDTYNPKVAITTGGQYFMGPRDEIEIIIWRCPELSIVTEIRPEDGSITMPLIGDVKATGRTPSELAKTIGEKMKFYVKRPRVAVRVKKFGEKKVFILGQVLSPGAYRMSKGDRLIDIIARAGGLNDNAIPSTTYIIRGGYEEHKMIRVNLGRLIYKGDVTQNVYLLEGDIVFVPVSELENLNYGLRKVFPSMYFAERLAELQRNIMTGGYDWGSAMWSKASQGRF